MDITEPIPKLKIVDGGVRLRRDSPLASSPREAEHAQKAVPSHEVGPDVGGMPFPQHRPQGDHHEVSKEISKLGDRESVEAILSSPRDHHLHRPITEVLVPAFSFPETLASSQFTAYSSRVDQISTLPVVEILSVSKPGVDFNRAIGAGTCTATSCVHWHHLNNYSKISVLYKLSYLGRSSYRHW